MAKTKVWTPGRGRHPFKTYEAAHVVDEVRHSDFAPRADDADGAHDHQIHARRGRAHSSRSIRDADIDAPAPPPAAIAAGVSKSKKHRELDARITELTIEREQIVAEMRALIATSSGELSDKEIRRAAEKREGIEELLNALLREVRTHRDTHSKAVIEALRPQGVEAAKAMIEGLHAFVAAVQKFNSCQDEIDRVGGEPQRVYIATTIGAYEHFARCFLESDR